MARVATSHCPLLVNTGVRSWKARRVPVGRRLARWAVLSKARCAIEGPACVGCGFFRSFSESESESEAAEAFFVEGSLCLISDIVVN